MASSTGELTLAMMRVLHAPRPVVFRALTEPEELATWWGPTGFTTPSAVIDLRVGGSYRLGMQPPEGELFYLTGEYLEVEPPARVTYTFRWEDPAPGDHETVVTLALGELGESTELSFTHGPFGTGSSDPHHDGLSERWRRPRTDGGQATISGGVAAAVPATGPAGRRARRCGRARPVR